jgi:release factor glutamine methyltransferase
MPNLRDLHREGRLRLRGLEDPDLEARLLLQHVCALSREEFAGHPDFQISPDGDREFFRLVNLRLDGAPLAYLTGEKEFWSHTFRVGPGVLIPRPETELILEKALESPPGEGEWVADIGTGCGCLALCLAEELPTRRVAACDISNRALIWARLNASKLDIRGVRFLKGDLLQPLAKLALGGRCGLIVSNPPYVSEEEWDTLDAGVRGYEPRGALVAGPSGLELIGRLADEAPVFLRSGGRLIV